VRLEISNVTGVFLTHLEIARHHRPRAFRLYQFKKRFCRGLRHRR